MDLFFSLKKSDNALFRFGTGSHTIEDPKERVVFKGNLEIWPCLEEIDVGDGDFCHCRREKSRDDGLF